MPSAWRDAGAPAARNRATNDGQKRRAAARARATVGAYKRGGCRVVDGVRDFEPWAPRLPSNLQAVRWILRWAPQKLQEQPKQGCTYKGREG